MKIHKIVKTEIGIINQNRDFAYLMLERELLTLGKGSILGFLWILIRPTFQVLGLIILYMVFMRGGNIGSLDPSRVLHIIGGLSAWTLMQKVIEDGPSLIRDRTEVLKQILYPLEILPLINMVQYLISTCVILLAYFVISGVYSTIKLSNILLPLPMILMIIFLIGASWILMFLGIVFKDLKDVLSLLMSFMVFVSPIMLDKSSSELVQSIVIYNPINHFIICFFDIFQGDFHLNSWIIFTFSSCLIFVIGAVVTNKAKLIIYQYI